MIRIDERPEDTSRTLMHMLKHAVERNASGEALVLLGGVRLSFSDLLTSVLEFSEELQARGSSGDRVAVALPNSADAVIAILGAIAARSQVVLLNPSYTIRELEPILLDADPLVIVCTSRLVENSDLVSRMTRSTPVVVCSPYESLVRRGAKMLPSQLLLPEPDDLAILQYTGGTTGRSKGVNLTHRTTALNIVQREAMLPTRFMRERFLCMTPLFHSYATATSFFPAIYSAGALVVMPRYDAEQALDAIEAERITLFCGAPTIYNGLVAHPRFAHKKYSTLIGAYSGAAPLSMATLSAWEQTTHVPIAEGYGLTEATAILCFNPLFGMRKAGSVGLPLPGTQIEIVDAEDENRVLGPGEAGELRARAPQIMTGYRGRPDETNAIIRDGWLYTGDIGEVDSDGYVFIRDRKKDMAIVGGYNVFPREVDEVLAAHPAVVDAVSVGVPDSYRGEVIEACVTLRSGIACDEEELRNHCLANLARYKVPAQIYIVSEVCKTPAGKIDRRCTREWLTAQPRDSDRPKAADRKA
jgi:long-chain acyl-CoA synthetase